MLDFRTVRDELDPLLESVCNKIEREWPRGKGNEHTPGIVWGNFRLSVTMFKAARYVAAESPLDFNRKPEYVLAVPPLVRSMADALSNLIYLFDDLDVRTNDYLRAGWREDYEHYERDKTRYASNPEYTEYLQGLEQRLEEIRTQLSITGASTCVQYWPILSRMLRGTSVSQERRDRLDFVEKEFYKELSSDTHLSGPGVYKRANFLLKPQHKLGTEDLEEVRVIRSEYLTRMILLLLCMSAEVEIALRFGLAERIIRMWTRIGHYMSNVQEAYDLYYRDILPPPIERKS